MEKDKKQQKRIESAKNFQIDPELTIFDELQDINDNIEDLAESLSTIDLSKLEQLKGDKGEDGKTPKKGIDYHTKDELDSFAKLIQSRIKVPTVDEVATAVLPRATPIKGKHYFDGYTPVKGVDYNDGKDGYTPIKGIDYYDGKDAILTPQEIVARLATLKDDDRLDIKYIKGLEPYLTRQTQPQGGIFRGGLWSGSANPFNINSSGTLVSTNVRSINFTGATVTDNNGDVTVAITGGGGSPSIGGAITGGTANSILFVNPNAIIAQDNANFSYVAGTGLNLGSANRYQINSVNMVSAQTALFNYYFGNSGNLTGTGQYNTSIGNNALVNVGAGTANMAIGLGSMAFTTSGSYNVGVGVNTISNNVTGSNNVAIGNQALQGASTFSFSNNVGIGYFAGQAITTGGSNLFLGYYAGSRVTTDSNTFYVNNIQQATLANDKAFSLLYGTFSGVAGSTTGQTLYVNAQYASIGTFTPPARVLNGMDVYGTDNTINGVQIGVGNSSVGIHGYSFVYMNNNLAVSADSTHYAGLGYTSSAYNDATFGAAANIANQFQLWNTDGPMTLLLSNATPQYFNIVIGGVLATNETWRFTNTGATVGLAGTLTGAIKFAGATSGTTTLQGTATGAGTLTLPATTSTIAVLGLAQTFTAQQTISTAPLVISGNQTTAAWTTAGTQLSVLAATLSDNTSSVGTVVSNVASAFGIPTFTTPTNAVTYTNGATLYVAGSPVAGTNVTITNKFAAHFRAAVGSQLLLSFDDTHSVTFAVNSSGNLSVSTLPNNGSISLNGSIFANGGIASSGTATASNFNVAGASGTTTESVSQYQFASSTTNYIRTGFFGNSGATPVANANMSNVIFGNPTTTLPATGTTPWLVNVAIKALGTITNGSAIPLTNTATVYIEGASASGTNNYALHVASGGTSLQGALTLKVTTVADVAYTALISDYIISYTSLTLARTVTLATTATYLGGQCQIIKDEAGTAGTNNITVTPASGTIDGAASKVINANYGVLRIYQRGGNFFTW